MEPQFISCYQGQSDYWFQGKRIEVKRSAEDWRPGVWNYTREEYERMVVALVGTVRWYCCSEFPPVEIERAFPGYVRARYNPETKAIEYADGKRPQQVHSAIYGTLAMPWYLEMKGYGWEVKEEQPAAV